LRTSDNDLGHIDDPTLRLPAESSYFRPDRSFIESKESCNDEITEDTSSPTDCNIRQRYICLSDALKLLRNQMSPRDALIFIARFYYRLKLKDLESIFRLDLTNISRVVQKAERKLKVRG